MADTRYEIIIQLPDTGELRYLDTFKYEPINLTFNVADIQDISKRNSSFSRTITLPETKNNRDVFGYISDLAADSTFDTNKKTKAWILVDTVPIFEGYLQLKAANLSSKLENTFEVVIFADNDTFFTRLGEKYITDLDYSDLNHTYSTQSIINSWTSGQELGYFYPLIDYGQGWTIDMIDGGGPLIDGMPGLYSNINNSNVNVGEIFPATYVKTIVDKIFSSAGFTYQSNFLNSQKFKNLLIPFNGTALNEGATQSDLLTFFVGVDGTQTLPAGNEYTTLQFSVYTPEPYRNENGLWNLDYYENPFVTNQRFILSLKFTTYNNAGVSNLKYFIFRERNPNTGVVDPSWASGLGYPLYENDFEDCFEYIEYETIVISPTEIYTYAALYDYTPWTGTNGFNANLFPNEKLRVVVVDNGFHTVDITDGYFANEVFPEVLQGGLIEYGNNVPKKIKQSDFIMSLVKMFNLYIEPSKTKSDELIIEPREDYYSTGVIKDWTNKIDLNTEIKETILADTQNRQTLFTFKDDKDRYNTLYKSSYNEIYGQRLYDSGNEFAKGTKKVETIFSPTPLAPVVGSINFVIPRIVKDDLNYNTLPGGRIDSNIRIVTRYNNGDNNGLIPFDNFYDRWAFQGQTFTSSYPYVGHYDNPYTPTYDINFGQLQEAFYETSFVTDNNLVEEYWAKFLQETLDKDSRLITVDMYLSPVDINNFRFNDSIYLFFNGSGHYYKVNKIEGYDPGQIKTCKVELIKSISRPVVKTEIKKPFRRPQTLLSQYSSNVISLKEGNTVISGGAITTGKDNFVRGNDIIVNGYFNSIDSSKGVNEFINGNANDIIQKNDNILINGDLNMLKVGAQITGTCSFVLISGTALSFQEPIIATFGTCGDDSSQQKIYLGPECSDPWLGCTAYNYIVDNLLFIDVYDIHGVFLDTVQVLPDSSPCTGDGSGGVTIRYTSATPSLIASSSYFTYQAGCNQYWQLEGDYDSIDGQYILISSTSSQIWSGSASVTTPFDGTYTNIQVIDPTTELPYPCETNGEYLSFEIIQSGSCSEITAASFSNRDILITGDSNQIFGSNSNVSISGNRNDIGTASNTLSVFGHDNTIGQNVVNSNVFGNNNVIIDGLSDVYLIGNNITVTQSNIAYIDYDVVFGGGASQNLQSVLDTGNTATSNGVFIQTGFSPSPGWFYMNDDYVFISSGGGSTYMQVSPDLVTLQAASNGQMIEITPDEVQINGVGNYTGVIQTNAGNSYLAVIDLFTLTSGQSARVKIKAIGVQSGVDAQYSEITGIYTYDGTMVVDEDDLTIGNVIGTVDLFFSGAVAKCRFVTTLITADWTYDVEYRIV